MPNINLDDAYILGETGAQVDKVTGLFTKDEDTTSGEKAFAQLNIGTAGSNRNLLDNPWFTVRQRGDGPFTAADTVGIDRWKTNGSSGSVTGNSGYVSVSNAAGATFYQRLRDGAVELGETYTASIMENDGTISTGTVVTSTNREYIISVGSWLVELDARAAFAPNYRFMVYKNSAWSGDFKAMKLEKGAFSTLANDAPPDYWEEYRKCRRYFKRLAPWQSGLLAVGRTDNATTANFVIGDEPMAKQTGITATITGSVNVRAGDNTNHAVTSIAVGTTEGGGIVLVCATTGLTAFASAALVLGSGGQIDISADL